MKRYLLPLALLTIPCMLFLVAVQSGRYQAVVAEVRALEKSQSEWVQENRKLLANIAVAGSRARIGESMAKAAGYRMVSPETTVRIRVGPGGEKLDG